MSSTCSVRAPKKKTAQRTGKGDIRIHGRISDSGRVDMLADAAENHLVRKDPPTKHLASDPTSPIFGSQICVLHAAPAAHEKHQMRQQQILPWMRLLSACIWCLTLLVQYDTSGALFNLITAALKSTQISFSKGMCLPHLDRLIHRTERGGNGKPQPDRAVPSNP